MTIRAGGVAQRPEMLIGDLAAQRRVDATIARIADDGIGVEGVGADDIGTWVSDGQCADGAGLLAEKHFRTGYGRIERDEWIWRPGPAGVVDPGRRGDMG